MERLKKSISHNLTIFEYRDMEYGFASPSDQMSAEVKVVRNIAYTRSLDLLRKEMGPYYNLSALWDKHVECEFFARDAQKIMETMVVDAYVNNIPTMTGEIDWLLPGVAPTNKYVEIPMVGIISFRGDKLCNEHIYWDQASVLVQIGVLDKGEIPVTGREQAEKLMGKSLPNNELLKKSKKNL
ncbi:6774_t:CDS:2 [Acaulospora colombiana]|uniref:6774_t:CDS:1 n=1 Tax=Acaulospora colombiana TaxID=27376 RepID=A0ACA9MDP9_9GLOM|nr:6774_t:CDS:2 [Acaulospora colombiana]